MIEWLPDGTTMVMGFGLLITATWFWILDLKKDKKRKEIVQYPKGK